MIIINHNNCGQSFPMPRTFQTQEISLISPLCILTLPTHLDLLQGQQEEAKACQLVLPLRNSLTKLVKQDTDASGLME